ncbi:MAG: hypothetical protein ABJ246_02760 [Paracoccaceae bacterium]
MKSLALTMSVMCLACPAMAKPWYCTAALDASVSELRSPVALELSLDPGGTFQGRLERRRDETTTLFDWNGQWTGFDDQIALIGTAIQDAGLASTELRAVSTRRGTHSLFLALQAQDQRQQTVRCLRTRME